MPRISHRAPLSPQSLDLLRIEAMQVKRYNDTGNIISLKIAMDMRKELMKIVPQMGGNIVCQHT